MDKKKLNERTGNLEQAAYVRRAVLTEGKAAGMKVIDAANAAGLSLTLAESRCLDIERLSYRGINMGFLSKAGLVSPQNLASVQGEFPKHFPGGMLYTCGLNNIGQPSEKDGNTLPPHGTIGMTPAENVFAEVDWAAGEVAIRGTMRAAELFGGNLTLCRTISLNIFENEIKIHDTLANEGFTDEDILLLYHFNFGYPMLSEELTLHIDGQSVEPRDSVAEAGKDRWNAFEAPTPGRPEEVFYHDPKAGRGGMVYVKLENSKLRIGAKLSFNKNELPRLIEWKSMMSGDYALGIEPATARVEGYATEKQAGRVITIKPGEKREFDLSLSFFDI